jgi:uncharacterized Zn finger protein
VPDKIEEPAEGVSVPPLHSARLPCEGCGGETPHRILHLERGGPGRNASVVRGVARCRTCGLSHPFVSTVPKTEEFWLIVSDGPRSERKRVTLPSDRKVQLGTGLPESDDPLEIHKIEDRTGRPISVGRVRDVRTVWAVRKSDSTVLYSLIEGRHTQSGRIKLEPGSMLEVGATMRLPTTVVTIVGLRARGQTWRQAGDRFPVEEVQRIYTRRGERPPAGSNDWSTERERPRSRASSTSRVARSRSSPGATRYRTVPRDRTADSGATVHRSSVS